MAPLRSENRDVVLCGLTTDRLTSTDVKTFGQLTVQEKKSAASVGGRAALAGSQSFELKACTPMSPPNAIPATCSGKGEFKASGAVSFDARRPLLLVEDEGDCEGECTVQEGTATRKQKVKCHLKITDSAQRDKTVPPTAVQPIAAPPRKAKPEQRPSESPVAAVCYLTATNELLLLEQAEYDEIRQAAAPLEKAIAELNAAKARDDTQAATLHQNQAKELLPPIKGLHLTGTDVAEVMDFRGQKMTYVRSDKIKNHFRRYPIDVDIRDQSLLRDKQGHFDEKKIKTAFKKLKATLPVGFASSDPWDRTLLSFAESLNNALRHESSGNPRFNTSAEARLFRLYGQWFKSDIAATSLKDWSFAASTQATLSIFEAAARFVWWPTTEKGVSLKFAVHGFIHPLEFGFFRPTLTGTVSGFVGVTLTAAATVELSKAKGSAGLTGSAEAFAGGKVEAKLTASLGWMPPSGTGDWLELGKVGYGVTGALGAGLAAEFSWGLDRKKHKIFLRLKAQLVFGAGGKGEVEFEADALNLKAVAICIIYAIRAADFQPLTVIEQDVREVLGDLLSWAAAAGRKLDEAYRMLELLRGWWRTPWSWVMPDELAGRLTSNNELLMLMPLEGKGKLVRLLCDTTRVTNRSQAQAAAQQILGSCQSGHELALVMAHMSPSEAPWPEDNGRQLLLASGLTSSGQLQRLAESMPPAANPESPRFHAMA